MTLPFDICTSLWLTSIPKWEWEPLPDAGPDGPAPPAADDASSAPAVDGATFAALPAPPPPPSATCESKPGHRLVFKGFEMAGKVFWMPADSPQSRPWVASRADDAHRHRHVADPAPKPDPDAAPPANAADAPPSDAPPSDTPDWERS